MTYYPEVAASTFVFSVNVTREKESKNVLKRIETFISVRGKLTVLMSTETLNLLFRFGRSGNRPRCSPADHHASPLK